MFYLHFFLYIPLVFSFKPNASPIQLTKPNANGVYEFDMVLKKKLTMSFSNVDEYKHTIPVDYNPHTRSWLKRNPDQVIACNVSSTMDFSHKNSEDNNYLADVLSLDGLHRRVITINGKSPGETIVVPYGAEVLLKVQNNILLDSVTIHVHGLYKKNLWYADGVAFVQQCPITSTTYYEYRFIADRIGTHWYHGHLQSDRGDGLLGGFVVVDTNDRSVPSKPDSRVVPDVEYMVMLQDWATTSNEDSWMMLDEKLMKWLYGYDDSNTCWMPTRLRDGSNVGGAVPISAILVNDKGWHNQEDIRKHPHKLPLEIFRVPIDKSVLFRIVNGGIAQELMVHIEGHPMTIVAADGSEVKPVNVSRLIIFPGERYDVLVHTLTNPDKSLYRMQIETIEYYNWNWTRASVTYGFAFLQYKISDEHKSFFRKDKYMWPVVEPIDCTSEKKCTVLNCPFREFAPEFNYKCITFDSLESGRKIKLDKSLLHNSPYKKSSFEEYFINMHFDSHVNRYKFEYPSGIPYYQENSLHQISKPCDPDLCPKNASKFDRNCNCFFHLRHKLNSIVQLTIYNMGQGGGYGTGYAHPFHVHGTHFYVVKVGWPVYNASGMIERMNPDIACGGPEENCDDSTWSDPSWLDGAIPNIRERPAERDTVVLPVGGYITIRFRASNPGWWFAHCHLVLHHMGGTAYAFKIGEEDEIPAPPPNFPNSCGPFFMDKINDGSPTQKLKKSQASSIIIHQLSPFICLSVVLLLHFL